MVFFLLMMTEFLKFGSEVFSHWQSLLTGGIIAVAILIYESLAKKSLTWRALLYVMGLALLISCFLAWRDEFHRANELNTRLNNNPQLPISNETAELLRLQKAESERREKRKEMRQIISQNLSQGNALLERIQLSNMSNELVSQKFKDWVMKTETYLGKNLGQDYVVRFRSPEGIQTLIPAGPPMSLERMNLYWSVYFRNVRLNQFLEELKD